jgi:sugar phosphate isomerase/epimerase
MQELSFSAQKYRPKLAFSTLGCPKWSLEQIVQCAADNGYQGIEIRGLQGQLDLPQCPEFSSPARLQASKALVVSRRLRIVDLGASAQMHHADPVKRKKNLDDARRFIDLAQQLDCPFVRVFPDDLPKEQEEQKTLDLIAQGLLELGNYAKGTGVSVLLESHGKVVSTELLLQVLRSAEHPQVGLIWDVYNMWSVTGEKPTQVYAQLKKYIRHIHLKDARKVEGKINYVLLGEGEAPLAEAISVLAKDRFAGYYSFEWEKMWHPEIKEPEEAIPHYVKAVKGYF